MSARGVCVLLVLCLALTASQIHAAQSRSLNRMVGQQPLLFGRRGINPNMNSLFFGKRSGMVPPPTMDDLKTACTLILSTYEQVVLGAENES